MRPINNIVVHTTATPQTTSPESIQRYWRVNLKWRNPGYHVLVEPNGTPLFIHPFDKPSNGVKGHNHDSIHISYIGGVHTDGSPIDNRTPSQKRTMQAIIYTLKQLFPNATVKGHRDFPGVTKACPCFDAIKEYA